MQSCRLGVEIYYQLFYTYTTNSRRVIERELMVRGTEKGSSAAFEVEVGRMEEFLRMLDMREAEQGHSGASYRSPIRRAVFVAALLDKRSSASQHGMTVVRRYVTAAFAWVTPSGGEDLVRMERDSSHTVEMNMPAQLEGSPQKLAERQNKMLEEIKASLERYVEERMLEVPVLIGALRSYSDVGNEGGARGR